MRQILIAFLCLTAVPVRGQVPPDKRPGDTISAGVPEIRTQANTDAGQFSTRGLWLPDGSLSVNCLSAGYANSATCASLIMNAPYARRATPGAAERGFAGVSPYMDDPVARAREPSHDQVDLYLEASSQPLGTPSAPNPGFAAFGISFDRLARSSGLPAAKHGFAMPSGHAIAPAVLSFLRQGMWVKTNQSPPLIGQLTSWDPEGRWFAVDSWTGQDGTNAHLDVADASVIPVMNNGPTEVIVDFTSAIWAINANVFCYEHGLADSCIGLEGTVNNDKPFRYNKFNPFMSAPRSWGDFWGGFRSQAFHGEHDSGPVTGADFVALGRVADGFLAFGGYNAGFNCMPDDPSAGITKSPGFSRDAAACYRAVIEAGTFARAESEHQGVTFSVSASGAIDLGAQGVATGDKGFGALSSQPDIRFHSAGGGSMPQASISSAGGVPGRAFTGSLAYRADRHEFSINGSDVGLAVQSARLQPGVELSSLAPAGAGDVALTMTASGRAQTTIGSSLSAPHLVPVPVSHLGPCEVGDIRFASDATRPGDLTGAKLGAPVVCALESSESNKTRWFVLALTPIPR